MKISEGDLVSRKYDLKMSHIKHGLVVKRDTNGFLVVNWGGKIEDFWDEYDLEIVSALNGRNDS